MKTITRIVVGALPTDLNADSKAELIKQSCKYIVDNYAHGNLMVVLTEDLTFEEEFKEAMQQYEFQQLLDVRYCPIIEDAFNLINEKEHADQEIFLLDSYFNVESLPSNLANVDKQVYFHFSEDGTVNSESIIAIKASLEHKPSNGDMIFTYNDLIGNKPDPLNILQISKQMGIITSEFDELTNAIGAYTALLSMPVNRRGDDWAEHFSVHERAPWYSAFQSTVIGTTWADAVKSQYTEIRDGCCDVDVTVSGLRHQMGWYPDADLEEVNASNMSKFSTNDDELKATLDRYAELGLDVEVVTTGSEILGQTHSVRSKETKTINGVDYRAGKQVKPPHYFKPNFSLIDVKVPLVLAEEAVQETEA